MQKQTFSIDWNAIAGGHGHRDSKLWYLEYAKRFPKPNIQEKPSRRTEHIALTSTTANIATVAIIGIMHLRLPI